MTSIKGVAKLARLPKPEVATDTGDARGQGIFGDLLALKRLWPYLRNERTAVLSAVVLIPAVSFFQTTMPLALRHAVDDGIVRHETDSLLFWSAVFGVTVVAEYLARAGQSIATSFAVLRMIRTLREKLFVHVLNLKSAFHDRTLSGTLTTRATGDFDNLSESLNMGVLTLVVDIAVLIGLIVGMALLSWQLTLCTLIILPIVGAIVQWFSRALKNAMVKARVKIAALNAYTQECLYGHVTIKVLTGEKAASKTFDRYNVEYRDAQMSSVILDAMMFAVLDGIASITVGLVLWVAASRLGLTDSFSSTISAGIIVAFVQYIQQLFDPLKNLGNKMAMLQGAFSSIDRIFGLLAKDDIIPGEKRLDTMEGHVQFEHVSFAYGEDSGTTLIDVSFDLPPGNSLAIVGPTGSGKSTIIKLLAKLYDGYEGQILIDGQELKPLSPEPLRQHMAIVPQDIVLFDGSIAFNISLGLKSVTLDDVQRAARQVGADSFIEKLPGGYHYHLKEGGINLSHGQRQLITFARALARRPSLVILDEATSSVDPESESIVQAAIQNILKGRTVIVIAHRLSTIRQCDKILVLERGQVVEQGNHDTLLNKGGAYYKLHTAFD